MVKGSPSTVCTGRSGPSLSVLTRRQRRVIKNQTMSDVHSQLSAQQFHVPAMTCRGRALAAVHRVQEGYGFEVWRQLQSSEFEPHLPARFQGITRSSAPFTEVRGRGVDLQVGAAAEAVRGAER